MEMTKLVRMVEFCFCVWVCDDVGSVRGRFKCCDGELEVVVIVLYVGKECSCGIYTMYECRL